MNRDIDWLSSDQDESLVWVFWDLAQTYAVKRWGRLTEDLHEVDVSDLQVLATEALIKFEPRFEQLEVELEGFKARRAMFFHFMKREIDQDALNLIHSRRRQPGPDAPIFISLEGGEETELPALIRTQLRAPQGHSTFACDLTAAIARFELAEQFTIALRFYEQKSTAEMADILGVSKSAVNERIKHAALRTLNAGLRLVESTPPEELEPPKPRLLHHMEHAERWTRDTYGCDLRSYLKYVAALYTLDVSSLTAALDRANGIFRLVNRDREADPRKSVRNGLAMPDEQVREIRKRLAAGESGKAIAEAFGIGRPTVSMIKNGKAYAYVA